MTNKTRSRKRRRITSRLYIPEWAAVLSLLSLLFLALPLEIPIRISRSPRAAFLERSAVVSKLKVVAEFVGLFAASVILTAAFLWSAYNILSRFLE